MNARILRQTAVGFAALGLLAPPTLLSAAELPATEPPAAVVPERAAIVSDVALTTGGVFSGQVVDAQGLPQAGTSVTICQQQQVVATATTDAQGEFSLHGLPGGMYQVVTGQWTASYRLWAPGTAPPGARQSALLVSGDEVIRGQWGLRHIVTNPWFITAAVATAIAVPIAVYARDKSSSS